MDIWDTIESGIEPHSTNTHDINLKKARLNTRRKETRNKAIIAFYGAGNSLECVGQKFEITRERVRQILANSGHFQRYYGINSPRRIKALEKEDARIEKQCLKEQARQERDKKLIALYVDEKLTYLEIQKITGVPVSQITKSLRKHGVQNRRLGRIGESLVKLTDQQRLEICTAEKKPGMCRRMAKKYNVCENYISVLRSLWKKRHAKSTAPASDNGSPTSSPSS